MVMVHRRTLACWHEPTLLHLACQQPLAVVFFDGIDDLKIRYRTLFPCFLGCVQELGKTEALDVRVLADVLQGHCEIRSILGQGFYGFKAEALAASQVHSHRALCLD